MRNRLIFFLLLFHLSSQTAEAELFKCKGVWQNKPCDGEASRIITETNSVLDEKSLKTLSKKKSLVHDITMRSLEAKRDYDIRTDLDNVEQVCYDTTKSIEECKSAISKVDSFIDDKLKTAALLKKTEETTDPKTESRSSGTENNTVISINRPDSEYYVIPRHGHYKPHRPVYPGHHGQHSQTITNSGAAISVGAGGTGGRPKVSVGFESQQTNTHQSITVK